MLSIQARSQGCLKLSVESLNDAVGTGMVCRGAAVLSSQQAVEGREEGTFKLSASIGGDGAGAAEATNPRRNEGLGDRFRSDVRDGHGFGPTGEAVNHCENIPAVTRRRKRSNQIKMYVVKATAGWQEGLCWSLCVASHFGSLTSDARAGPLANISVNAWPNIPVCNEALRGSDAGVADVVKRVKNSTTESSGNKGARGSR